MQMIQISFMVGQSTMAVLYVAADIALHSRFKAHRTKKKEMLGIYSMSAVWSAMSLI